MDEPDSRPERLLHTLHRDSGPPLFAIAHADLRHLQETERVEARHNASRSLLDAQRAFDTVRAESHAPDITPALQLPSCASSPWLRGPEAACDVAPAQNH